MKNVKFVAGLTIFLILLSCVCVKCMPYFIHCDFEWKDGQGQIFKNTLPPQPKDGTTERDLKAYIPDDCHLEVTTAHISELRTPRTVGRILLCLFALGLFCLCFFFICRDIRRRRYFGAMGTIAIITLLLIGISFCLLKQYPLDLKWLVIMLLSLPPLIITPLFGFRPAVCVGMLVSFLTAILFDTPLKIIAMGMVLCCAGGFFIQYCRIASYRKYIFYNFVSIMIAATLLHLCFEFTLAEHWIFGWSVIKEILLIALIGSAISVAIAVIFLPLIEWLFRIETNMTYMDLSNKDHSLLQRLMTEAPGTWEHCQEVADVASDAAMRISANALKVKACALYHDVGKLSAPEMFTENSPDPSGWTKVNDMDPLQAAQILRSHVDEGKKLIHYPHKSIKEAIASHHGNMRIGIFYEKAVKMSGNDVDEADFRYHGPLPANREEVILMLADSACAAVKSISEKTPESIENKVSEIFVKQLEQRQYDQSGITVRDMLTVYSSILNSLLTKYKSRISYKKAENVQK